jgi:diguanylate cyclase (GGDEF)-like protein
MEERRERTEERAEPTGPVAKKRRQPASSWPDDTWPFLVEHLIRGEDYVLFLDASWGLRQANDSFQRSIAGPVEGARQLPVAFLDTLAPASAEELRGLAARGELDGTNLELRHVLPTGTRTVEYRFRAHQDGWVVIGRDQSVQLELVKQMSVLVEELEAKFHREKTLSENLRALAEKDHLTALPNRRHFERLVEACQRSYESEGQPFSVLCLDIDHYKQVNDLHGHPVGDIVLQRVAQALEVSIRDGDCAARYGGDEFTILAVGVAGSQAIEMAERLRQKIEKAEMPDAVRGVTISVGVASTKPGDVERARQLTKLADGALYLAKAQGRNRVQVAD